MNISSILITIVGIVIILALYVLSRAGQNKLPNNGTSKLPEIKDKDGNAFTSVLDDIPASDEVSSKLQNIKQVNKDKVNNKDQLQNNKIQIVLFISGKDDTGLDGNLIQQTLLTNGLKLGDKDIYHYYQESDNQLNSMFRVANGVEPWTLKDENLMNKKLVGISMVMLLSKTINNKEATNFFLSMADNITEQVNGVLKNQQQELLSEIDRNKILTF